MTLIAGKIITDGISYAFVDAEPKIIHKLSYEKVKKINPNFKWNCRNMLFQGGFWGNLLLYSDAYICNTFPSIEESKFTAVEDYLQFASFNPGVDIYRYTAGVTRKRDGEYFITCDFNASIKINPDECSELIKAQYILIVTEEERPETYDEATEKLAYMFPLTDEKYREYEKYKETEIDDLPPSLRF